MKDELLRLMMAFVVWTVATLSVAQSQQHQRRGHLSETTAPMVHDPVMAYADSTYHLFSTGWGIQHATSRDLRTWLVADTPVMTVIPQWARDSVPGFVGHVWAPDVIQWHGRWWMAYSCSTFGRNGSAIGLLSNRSLSARSPWSDEGCIVCSREGRDNWNAIDPNFIIDADDQPWMTYGSFWDGIQIVRLDTTMHVAQGCKPVTIARRHATDDTTAEPNPTSKFAGTNAIEAPFIFHRNGWYYLFVSWDYCCRGIQSNYRVAVGRSRSVEGPYTDREGRPMLQGGGTLFVEGDKKEFEALGHCAVYHIDNRDIFICHGYSIAHEGASILVSRNIRWTPDGWPEL
ncbi:MAG: family 43 glycosylhydrolase [Prevotella sp.]|nr:family 43 glycosylhydrolase [Prevotella sp.]